MIDSIVHVDVTSTVFLAGHGGSFRFQVEPDAGESIAYTLTVYPPDGEPVPTMEYTTGEPHEIAVNWRPSREQTGVKMNARFILDIEGAETVESGMFYVDVYPEDAPPGKLVENLSLRAGDQNQSADYAGDLKGDYNLSLNIPEIKVTTARELLMEWRQQPPSWQLLELKNTPRKNASSAEPEPEPIKSVFVEEPQTAPPGIRPWLIPLIILCACVGILGVVILVLGGWIVRSEIKDEPSPKPPQADATLPITEKTVSVAEDSKPRISSDTKIQKTVLPSPGSSLQVSLSTGETNEILHEGDTLEFTVRANQDCHLAVLCHQSDGTSIVLFPNAYNRDTWIPGNRTLTIPGDVKQGFELVVGPPFGRDRIQVLASHDSSSLHQWLANAVASLDADHALPYVTRTRGIMVKEVENRIQALPSKNLFESNLTVETRPKS